MKTFLKSGFFYNVYDIGNGRVLKIEIPRIIQFIKHFFLAGRFPSEVVRCALSSYKLIESITDKTILANPKIESSRSYSQDYVLTLDGYLSQHTFEENCDILTKYADHILQTWQNGFCEKIFNFTFNCGIDRNNNVVLVDFNEITLDKEETRKLIINKRWLHSWSHTHALLATNKELRKYYTQIMSEKINFENLDKYWKSNI